jgi:hypothetical protein
MIERMLMVLLFLGCAGSADDAEAFGWCCDGVCGLSAEDANNFARCTCDGIVRPVPGTPGACIERGEPWR